MPGPAPREALTIEADQAGVDEEQDHLNYLGSMLGRPNTPEEQEMEEILDALEKAARTSKSRVVS